MSIVEKIEITLAQVIILLEVNRKRRLYLLKNINIATLFFLYF